MTDSLGRLTSQSSLYIGLALLVVVYIMPSGILGLVDLAVRAISLERRHLAILHRREGFKPR